jgi:protein-tyrosine phosphatase
MASFMIERVLPFAAIHNFRDYGGYAARDGARVKTGILFRSGQHLDATADDLARVDALSLRTVIDLRGDSERGSYPCPRPTGFDARVLFAEGETAGHAPHVEASRGVRTADDAAKAMTELYRDMPFRGRLIEIFTLYFDALASREGPSLIHCLAGKDRTGIGVALLHHLLGVHSDDIMADYLLTNTAGNIEQRIAAGAKAVRNGFGRNMDEDGIRTVMSVDTVYLDAAFSAIAARHASIEGYCEEVLRVTPAMRQKLEAALLV